VEGARREYAIAFGRRVAGDATVSNAYAGAGVSGGRRGEAFGAGRGTDWEGARVLRETAQRTDRRGRWHSPLRRKNTWWCS